MIQRIQSRLKRLVVNDMTVALSERLLKSYYRQSLRKKDVEWFDHRADLFLWSETRNDYWTERGVYARASMKQGDRVLDMCCGDGFYSYHYYSTVAKHIDAIDIDEKSMQHAGKFHKTPNITYKLSNILTDPFPQGAYDVVIWDASVEHFDMPEIETVLGKCAKVLEASQGVLCGYTIIARKDDGPKHGWHKHEFSDAEELKAVFGKFFPYVTTFESKSELADGDPNHTKRHNIYFKASFDKSKVLMFSL